MSFFSPLPQRQAHFARAVVARHTGARLADLHMLQDGNDHWVARLVLADGQRLILKAAAADHQGPRFETALGKAKAVRALTDVPLPEPLAADDGCRESGWRFLLQEHVAGTVWFERLSTLDAPAR